MLFLYSAGDPVSKAGCDPGECGGLAGHEAVSTVVESRSTCSALRARRVPASDQDWIEEKAT
jgi:hypothetical protein